MLGSISSSWIYFGWFKEVKRNGKDGKSLIYFPYQFILPLILFDKEDNRVKDIHLLISIKFQAVNSLYCHLSFNFASLLKSKLMSNKSKPKERNNSLSSSLVLLWLPITISLYPNKVSVSWITSTLFLLVWCPSQLVHTSNYSTECIKHK